MADNYNNLNNKDNKEKKTFKVMGFEIGMKHIIIIGILVAIVFVGSKVSDYLDRQEIKERQEEVERRRAEAEARLDANHTEQLTQEERDRQRRERRYGTPPDGFEWSDDGELIAISDESKTAEEVLYTFIRSLSLEDLSTAQKYSYKSRIISKYESFFDEHNRDANYYRIFLRKEFKIAMQSIEVLNAEDSIVQADGTTVISMRMRVLNLANKDFWLADTDEIFNTLRGYRQEEKDSIKGAQYVYDYIYDAYTNQKVDKREIVCNFKLTKENGQGWLVRDDSELLHYLLYEEGVNVYKDITDKYKEWYQDVKEAERREADLQRRQ